jgi:hypothetical protein
VFKITPAGGIDSTFIPINFDAVAETQGQLNPGEVPNFFNFVSVAVLPGTSKQLLVVTKLQEARAGVSWTRVLCYRALANGNIDRSFTMVLLSSPYSNPRINSNGLAVQADGKFYISGYLNGTLGAPNVYMYVNRFLANGLPDPSFGTNGQYIVPKPYQNLRMGRNQMVLNNFGKILLFATERNQLEVVQLIGEPAAVPCSVASATVRCHCIGASCLAFGSPDPNSLVLNDSILTIDGNANLQANTALSNSSVIVSGRVRVSGALTVQSSQPPGSVVTVVSSSDGVVGSFDTVNVNGCPATSQTSGGLSVVVTVPEDCNSGSLSTGAIVGIAIGAVVGGVLLGLLVVVLTRYGIAHYNNKASSEIKNNRLMEVEMV